MGRFYALTLLLLAGCDSISLSLTKPKPQTLNCPAGCYVVCDPLPKWGDGDRDHEDTIVYVDGLLYAQCSARHQACLQCLNDAKAAGAIQ